MDPSPRILVEPQAFRIVPGIPPPPTPLPPMTLLRAVSDLLVLHEIDDLDSADPHAAAEVFPKLEGNPRPFTDPRREEPVE